FDVVLIDPPRKGSTPEALENVISLTSKYLIYVSCNPATLARDLKYLIEKEFIPEYVQPVDMFPNTSHIETVVVLKNCNKKEAI
ncbi:23S rRNA (uracil-5-)-methyltransferase RumA, partial [bacterium]|nr:23S rRNA (uracil-5-)-methyltransferase RumA [bacterium]